MKRDKFQIKKPSAKTWEKVFKKPGDISVESFVTAEAVIKKGGALNLRHPDAQGMKDGSLKVPVLSHWIRHKKFGDYLIDGGMDASYRKRRYGRFRGILVRKFMGKCVQQKGQDILSRIKENQIDLKGIFFTHLHFDHISGVIDLPKDAPIQYVSGRDERYFVVKKKFLFQSPNFLAGIEIMYEIDFTNSNVADMPIVGKCADIFGDGSFWAISTPGHTKGHLSFLVNTNQGSGPVLITGDACLVRTGFDKDIGPGTYSGNVAESQKSLDKLLEFSRKFPGIKIVCGHELP